jgi:MFS family permease
MIVPFLFLLVVSPASGMLYDAFGSRRLCLIGMGLLMISLASFMTLAPAMGLFSILWRIALAGIGTALFVSPNNTVIMSSIPLYRRGVASGTVATARNIGMVVGVALAGLIFTASFTGFTHGATLETYTPEMAAVFMISFQRAMLMGTVLAILGLGVTFVRGEEKK